MFSCALFLYIDQSKLRFLISAIVFFYFFIEILFIKEIVSEEGFVIRKGVLNNKKIQINELNKISRNFYIFEGIEMKNKKWHGGIVAIRNHYNLLYKIYSLHPAKDEVEIDPYIMKHIKRQEEIEKGNREVIEKRRKDRIKVLRGFVIAGFVLSLPLFAAMIWAGHEFIRAFTVLFGIPAAVTAFMYMIWIDYPFD